MENRYQAVLHTMSDPHVALDTLSTLSIGYQGPREAVVQPAKACDASHMAVWTLRISSSSFSKGL